jgi:diguanylate cyclase (GGDEF)-like protein
MLLRLLTKPFGNSLKSFLFTRILFISLLTFAGVLLTATLLYEKLLSGQAAGTARGIAEQTFTSIDTLMNYGPSREELESFIADLKDTHAASPYHLEVYRSYLVDELYGPIDQPAISAEIVSVLQSGKNLITENGSDSRYLMPLLASDRCLGCHANASPGAILGVVEVGQNLSAITSGMRARHTWLFIFYGLTILALIISVALFVAAKITSTIELFRRKTAAVNSLADLNSIETIPADALTFSELNSAFDAVSELAGRLRHITVDKDVLEFEIKVLGKFIITSHVIQDWRGFVKELLIDINSIIDTYALFVFFEDEEKQYKIDIFWRDNPSLQNREVLESTLRRRVCPHFNLAPGHAAINISHHIAESAVPIPHTLDSRDIELHLKSLRLDSPRIDGVVGIMVQSHTAEDTISNILLDSVLAALLNLIGSVKAILTYTKTLEYYATRDPLTNLHNQRMFWEILGYETSRADRHDYSFAVMTIDLDNFKTVNDKFGHAYGDSFLNQFADVLRKSVREGDFVCRYGGDEFTLILPETELEQAYWVGTRVAENLTGSVIIAPDGSRIYTTISIGIACYPEHGKTPRDLFHIADSMMYKVKGEGKNAIATPESEDLAGLLKDTTTVNTIVFQALEQQNLFPYFQPILRLDDRQFFGHELLMRIKLPDGRMLPASDFIQAAEEMGLMYQLERQLLEKALTAVVEQEYAGTLFINVSPKMLISPEAFSRINQLTGKYRLVPERLVFEISERTMIGNIDMLQKFAARMKDSGYKLAIDDFGGGYSSFRHLKLLPVDFLKIEGHLLLRLREDPDYLAFLKSIVTLAKEMGISTVAKHVADEELLAIVENMGIDHALGFHIGQPRPHFSPAQDDRFLLP